jgi:hypothetical protein
LMADFKFLEDDCELNIEVRPIRLQTRADFLWTVTQRVTSCHNKVCSRLYVAAYFCVLLDCFLVRFTGGGGGCAFSILGARSFCLASISSQMTPPPCLRLQAHPCLPHLPRRPQGHLGVLGPPSCQEIQVGEDVPPQGLRPRTAALSVLLRRLRSVAQRPEALQAQGLHLRGQPVPRGHYTSAGVPAPCAPAQ